MDLDQSALDLIENWEMREYLHPSQKKAALQVAIRDAMRGQAEEVTRLRGELAVFKEYDPASAALIYELTQSARTATARAEAAEARLAEVEAALRGAVKAIEWWEDEHGCCAGATDDALAEARQVLEAKP